MILVCFFYLVDVKICHYSLFCVHFNHKLLVLHAREFIVHISIVNFYAIFWVLVVNLLNV